MEMAYTGPHAFVDVPMLGIVVERGEPIDIKTHRQARQLRRQGWSLVKNDDNGEGNA